jgi:hypothetical protein
MQSIRLQSDFKTVAGRRKRSSAPILRRLMNRVSMLLHHNLVAFTEEKLGEVSPILSGDTCYESTLRHL